MGNGKISSAFFWEGLTRIGAEGVMFLLQLVLARLLTPEDFGVLAILMVFVALEEVFIESGFRSSLIQKKGLTDVDCQSVFWLQLSVGLILYLLLWFLAPVIAGYYKKEILSRMLRVIALVPVIHSLTMVHMAKLLREMKFKQKLPIQWSGILIGGLVGIGMAYAKCGVWALIGQQLVQSVVSGLATLFFVRWMPRLMLDLHALKELFRFGVFLLGNSLFSTGVSSFFRFIISSFFSMATLGLYNMGNGIPRMAMSSLNLTIINVLFPAFSKLQDSEEKLRNNAKSIQNVVNFLVFPMLFCLIAVASPLIRIFLGDKWMACIPMLQILSFGYLFWPSNLINLQICNSLGHSRLSFILECVKSFVLIGITLFCCHMGVLYMCWGFVVYCGISFFVTALPTGRFIHYGPLCQFAGLLKKLLISGGTAFCTCILLGKISSMPMLQLCFGVFFYGILYLSLNFLMNRRELAAVWNVGIGLFGKRG